MRKKIIDCHTHLGLANKKEWTPSTLLRSMDQAGISYSLVIANNYSENRSMSTEKVIAICEKNPRLKAIGGLDYRLLSKEYIETLCQYLYDKKIYGLKFYPGYQTFYPDDPRLELIYKYCSEGGYPVIFHTGILEINQPGLLKQSHPLNIDDVANKFPNLKIVMSHMGNPWFVDTAAILYKRKNVYVDISAFFEEYKKIPNEDIECFVRKVVEIKKYVGNFDKFLFGTDYPLYSQKEYLNAAQQIPLTDEEKNKVFFENAKELFQLPL